MKGLSEDIKQIIKDKLPETTAGVLQEYLQEFDGIKSDFKKSEEKVVELQNTIKKLQKEIKEHEGRFIFENELKEKEKDISQRELKMDLNESQVSNAISQKELAVDLFKTVFNNVTVSESILSTVDRQKENKDDHYAPHNLIDRKNTTKTTTKTKQ
jgi:hypothetical protein